MYCMDSLKKFETFLVKQLYYVRNTLVLEIIYYGRALSLISIAAIFL